MERIMKKRKKWISGLLAAVFGMLMPITAFASEGSLGQMMREASFNTVLGIGTVFIMLIVIALIIYCFRFIPMLQKKFSKSKKEEAAVLEQPQKMAQMAPAPSAPEDDLELIAVIAAAIAASEQVPPDSFVVRTIKRRR